MDVTWLGHGCFRLRGRSAVAITDPYPPSIGLKLPRLEADLVTISHPHENHTYVEAVKEGAQVVDGPGEYEVSGITVLGFPTFHDRQQGADRGRNTVYVIEVDEVRVCHLGDLGHPLDEDDLDEIGTIDVLLAPVGGGNCLDGEGAAAVVRQIEPRIVVPMHYSIQGLKKQLDGVERFLKEMGVTEAAEPLGRLSVQATTAEPETTRVVVLEAKT